MNAAWLKILKQQVEAKGAATVAREVGISPTSLSLILAGKYPAKTANVERKVLAVYGTESGLVACPALGEIEPALCAQNFNLAKKIGVRCGNPATLKLYKTCIKCAVRN
ncbi:MAG: hypothetical protein ABFS18_02010 [Thermodesulfobacteriota bacterium]